MFSGLPMITSPSEFVRPVPPSRQWIVVPVRNFAQATDRKSTRLNSSHPSISYAVFCVQKKTSHSGGQTNKQHIDGGLRRRYVCHMAGEWIYSARRRLRRRFFF